MIRYFDSFDEFVRATGRFKEYLTQCLRCRLVWISHDTLKILIKEERILSQEEWEMLQKCLAYINSWGPNVKELEGAGLFVSHGLCAPCTRDRLIPLIRPKQARDGYRQCFGTAIDGHCSEDGTNGRPLCTYYCGCVVSQQELVLWEEKLKDIQS